MNFNILRQIIFLKNRKAFFSDCKVLGIESTCDDSSAAVVDNHKNILGDGHFSQASLHNEIGGILPHVAYNFHKEYLEKVVETAMKNSKLEYKDIDAIAVAVKPGLKLSLKAGLNFTKDLSRKYNKPIIPIHHMEAHALTGRLVENVKFPFLALLISGGHSILTLVKSVDEFYTLGKHKDSSPGNVMDKIARKAKLKNLKEYSGMVGGAAIEAAATLGNPLSQVFSVNYRKPKSCNFSFGGLLSTANNYIDKLQQLHCLEPDELIPNIHDFCACFQWEVTKIICRKLECALFYANSKNLLGSTKYLVVSGGVGSNKFISEIISKVCECYEFKLVVPPPELCTDNGKMIAWNGVEKLLNRNPLVYPEDLDSINFSIKCPLGEDLSTDVDSFLKTYKFQSLPLTKILKNEISEVKKSALNMK